jgi:hypothetical protein
MCQHVYLSRGKKIENLRTFGLAVKFLRLFCIIWTPHSGINYLQKHLIHRPFYFQLF